MPMIVHVHDCQINAYFNQIHDEADTSNFLKHPPNVFDYILRTYLESSDVRTRFFLLQANKGIKQKEAEKEVKKSYLGTRLM